MSVIWTNPENIYSLRVLPPLTHFGPYGALEPFGAEADYLPLFVKNPLAQRPNSAKATPSKASGERQPPEATDVR
jgi:hypothetical protein